MKRKGAAILVVCVIAVMSGIVLVCIVLYGRNVPIAEDWVLVPSVTGHEAHVWSWLWSQNNEHRLPIPRLVLLALITPTRDFRAGMLGSTAMTTAVVVSLTTMLWRMRGGAARFTDAFLPLAFLHLGHWENLLWAWELSFVLSAALCCVVLVALMEESILESRARARILAAALAALPLCGATGLVPALPIAIWLLAESFVERRTAREPAASKIVVAGAACTLGCSALYFVGYQHASWNPPSPGMRATLSTTVKTMAMGLGPAALWLPPALIVCLAAIPVVGAWILITSAMGQADGRRARARRLLAFSVGIAALALSIGWGRAGLVPTVGLPQRYALLIAPLFAATCVAADQFAGTGLRRALQVALVAAACALLPLNVRAGLDWRDWYVNGTAGVERDIAAGASPVQIAQAHEKFLYPWGRSTLVTDIEWLRDAHIGPFAEIGRNP